MPVPQQFRPSLKRRADSDPPSADESRPVPKKHKSDYSTHARGVPSPEFWDRLSRVQLSRQALREFDRRTLLTSDTSAPLAPTARNPLRGSRSIQLKRLAQRGGPPLTHIRGFAHRTATMSFSSTSSRGRKRPAASSRTSARTQSTGVTKTTRTTPYSAHYERALNDAGVYLEGHDYDSDDTPIPANLDDIQRQLTLARASLSPSRYVEEDFKEFKRINAQARGEARVMQTVLEDISGIHNRHFKTETDVEFNHIRPFNKDLAAAKPDIYDGVLRSTVDRRVQGQLDDLILPCTTNEKPAVPNFFLEAKSEKGTIYVGKKQACHNGAIGARAIHSLQNYGVDEPVYDGNAYSFTSTYHDGQLKMYTTHPTAPTTAGEEPRYHMTQVKAFAMTSDRETFQKGAAAYRNARDLASTHRKSFVEQANAVAATFPVATPSTSAISRRTSATLLQDGDSDTSLDELALDVEHVKRARHRLSSARSSRQSRRPQTPEASPK